MSLNGALQIGRSSLTVSQAALQVAGNNMANASTEGFHRRSVHMAPMRGQLVGNNSFIGRGVDLLAVRREVDTALQARFRQATADTNGSIIDQRFLSAMETIQNELTDNDLSSVLSRLFNAFSEVANSPEDSAVRSLAVEEGQSVADHIINLRSQYEDLRSEADRAVTNAVRSLDEILDQVAEINLQIATTEGGGAEANSLRDQRDILIDEASQFVNISTIDQANGVADVYIGSIPVVLGTESRGVTMTTESAGDDVEVKIRVEADGSFLDVNSGTIGGLIRQRNDIIEPQIDTLDTFAGQLIHQVNKLHSSGQGQQYFTSLSGAQGIADTTISMNLEDAEIPFDIENGSFFLHVTDAASGLRNTFQINVDGDSMSVDDLVDEINTVVGVPNITASIGGNGNLVLDADAGFEFSFSDDTSGALAALGLNTFFTGENGSDIGINQVVSDNPGMLAAGAGHVPGSNDTAASIASLQDTVIDELSGQSLRSYWQASVNELALDADSANKSVQSNQVVQESLRAQVQAVSGVSLDEESINMLQYQRQYQASARYITVVDEMLQTLLSIA